MTPKRKVEGWLQTISISTTTRQAATHLAAANNMATGQREVSRVAAAPNPTIPAPAAPSPTEVTSVQNQNNDSLLHQTVGNDLNYHAMRLLTRLDAVRVSTIYCHSLSESNWYCRAIPELPCFPAARSKDFFKSFVRDPLTGLGISTASARLHPPSWYQPLLPRSILTTDHPAARYGPSSSFTLPIRSDKRTSEPLPPFCSIAVGICT